MLPYHTTIPHHTHQSTESTLYYRIHYSILTTSTQTSILENKKDRKHRLIANPTVKPSLGHHPNRFHLHPHLYPPSLSHLLRLSFTSKSTRSASLYLPHPYLSTYIDLSTDLHITKTYDPSSCRNPSTVPTYLPTYIHSRPPPQGIFHIFYI